MEHTKYECKCNTPYCQFCEGGLFSCTVCGGFEGTLTTDCPGTQLHEKTLEDIYKGKLDYRENRGFVVPDGTGKSMGDSRILAIERKRKWDEADANTE